MVASRSPFWLRSRERRASDAHVPVIQATNSVSLRWRVMLLAMSMVAMVVVLYGRRGLRGGLPALYNDIDSQLHSRAQLLIESGSLWRGSRQGDRGHRLLRRQRDAGQPR